jgi:hypothetical protein
MMKEYEIYLQVNSIYVEKPVILAIYDRKIYIIWKSDLSN